MTNTKRISDLKKRPSGPAEFVSNAEIQGSHLTLGVMARVSNTERTEVISPKTLSKNQEYIQGDSWKCSDSPTGAHHWVIDRTDKGKCQHCKTKRIFK